MGIEHLVGSWWFQIPQFACCNGKVSSYPVNCLLSALYRPLGNGRKGNDTKR